MYNWGTISRASSTSENRHLQNPPDMCCEVKHVRMGTVCEHVAARGYAICRYLHSDPSIGTGSPHCALIGRTGILKPLIEPHEAQQVAPLVSCRSRGLGCICPPGIAEGSGLTWRMHADVARKIQMKSPFPFSVHCTLLCSGKTL